MGSDIGKVLGFGGGSKVISAPIDDTEEKKKRARAARTALYETEGGAQGAELNPGMVSKRDTIYGN